MSTHHEAEYLALAAKIEALADEFAMENLLACAVALRALLTADHAKALGAMKAAAWDEGHRLTRPHSDRCEPTCPNPYRADRLTTDTP